MATNLILIRQTDIQSDTVNVRQEQISCLVMGNTNTKNSFRSNIAPVIRLCVFVWVCVCVCL